MTDTIEFEDLVTGYDFRQTVRLRDPDGNRVDLTGATVVARLVTQDRQTVLIDDQAVTISDATQGVCSVLFTATATAHCADEYGRIKLNGVAPAILVVEVDNTDKVTHSFDVTVRYGNP